jgi:hypothetical protein
MKDRSVPPLARLRAALAVKEGAAQMSEMVCLAFGGRGGGFMPPVSPTFGHPARTGLPGPCHQSRSAPSSLRVPFRCGLKKQANRAPCADDITGADATTGHDFDLEWHNFVAVFVRDIHSVAARVACKEARGTPPRKMRTALGSASQFQDRSRAQRPSRSRGSMRKQLDRRATPQSPRPGCCPHSPAAKRG